MTKQDRRSRRGLTAIEYALLASLIAVGILVSLSVMSNNISSLFNNLGIMIAKQENNVIK
jgi:Flp pilus assembly pilin Flp